MTFPGRQPEEGLTLGSEERDSHVRWVIAFFPVVTSLPWHIIGQELIVSHSWLLSSLLGGLSLKLFPQSDLTVVVYLLSCVQLWDLMDCSPPCSSVPGILQERIYCSGLPLSTSGDLPDPGMEAPSPASPLHCRQILYHEPLAKPNWPLAKS